MPLCYKSILLISSSLFLAQCQEVEPASAPKTQSQSSQTQVSHSYAALGLLSAKDFATVTPEDIHTSKEVATQAVHTLIRSFNHFIAQSQWQAPRITTSTSERQENHARALNPPQFWADDAHLQLHTHSKSSDGAKFTKQLMHFHCLKGDFKNFIDQTTGTLRTDVQLQDRFQNCSQASLLQYQKQTEALKFFMGHSSYQAAQHQLQGGTLVLDAGLIFHLIDTSRQELHVSARVEQVVQISLKQGKPVAGVLQIKVNEWQGTVEFEGDKASYKLTKDQGEVIEDRYGQVWRPEKAIGLCMHEELLRLYRGGENALLTTRCDLICINF